MMTLAIFNSSRIGYTWTCKRWASKNGHQPQTIYLWLTDLITFFNEKEWTESGGVCEMKQIEL